MTYNNTPWQSWTNTLRNAPDHEVNEIEHEFTRAVHGQLNKIAAIVVRESGHKITQFWGDAQSIVGEEFTCMMRELRTGKLDQISSFPGILKRRTTIRFRNFLGTESGTSVAAGMVALRRRQDMLWTVRRELTQLLGREPSDQEIVDAANEKMRANRKNPTKNGLAKLSDLAPQQKPVPLDATSDFDRAAHNTQEPLIQRDPDTRLHSLERRQLARLMLLDEQANQTMAHTRMTRLIWGPQLEPHPSFPPVPADLVDEFPGMARSDLNRIYVFVMRTRPQQILAAKFGIT